MPTPTDRHRQKPAGLREVPPGRQGAGEEAGPPPKSALHNLPRELSSFVGRQQEQKRIVEFLGSTPLVTITGPPGIGKTRLALQVAGQLLPEVEGGVWLVELAGIPPTNDPNPVTEAVAAVLEPRTEPGRRRLSDPVLPRPRDTHMLVILDNCEHLVGAAAKVANDLLNGWPNMRVLATSQQPLGVVGEQVLPLQSLSLPVPWQAGAGAQSEAVALFHARAKATQRSFVVTEESEAAVGEICRRLEGNPLAVELAAARITVLSPVEIAEHLHERFSLLSTTAPGTAPRHQSLQSALDWSYDLLSEPERVLLRRLSIFAGGAALDQVREICAGPDLDATAVVDLLNALVSKSLVIAQTGGARARYRMLETVRAYARDRLDEAGEAGQLARAHAQWCIAFAESGWDEMMVSSPRATAQALEQEHDNLRAALGWLLEVGDAGAVLRLSGSLISFWKLHGHLREGRGWLERALAIPAADGAFPAVLRIRALSGTGMLATLHGDLSRARSAFEEARDLAITSGREQGAVRMNMLLGFACAAMGDTATGLSLLEQSVQATRESKDLPALYTVLGFYGRARLLTGDTLGALEVFDECDRTGQSLPDGDDGSGLLGLGGVALAQGRHDKAQKLLEQALALMRGDDEHFEMALVLSFLGELAWLRGDDSEARALLQEGLELARSMGAPHPEARCMLGLDLVAWASGEPAGAGALAAEAVAIARRAGQVHTLVRCLQSRAELGRLQGEDKAAQAALEESLSLATASGDRSGMAKAKRCLGVLLRLQGDYHGAASMHLEALEASVKCGDEGGVIAVLEALAGLDLAQNRRLQPTRLLGAASAMRAAAGCLRSPLDQSDYDSDLALLRAALDAERFDKEWKRGAALSRADALAMAIRSRGSRGRPEMGLAALTPAEKRVFELVTERLTNNEIAECLGISRRTAEVHVARIFAKVGVTSRRQLRELTGTAEKPA